MPDMIGSADAGRRWLGSLAPGPIHEDMIGTRPDGPTLGWIGTRAFTPAETDRLREAARFTAAPLAALAAGSAVEKVWGLGEHDDEPPLTRFLAEQMSTAHWFDQRRTREMLQWTPRVSMDEGNARLAEWFREHPVV